MVGTMGAGRRPTSEVMSRRLDGAAAILGQEGLFERWLAAHEVEELVVRRLADDRRDRSGDAQPEQVLVGADVADAGQRGKGADRDLAREAELDLVVGEVAQRLDTVDPDEPAVTDDRHAVAGLLDLAEDV